ncbi:MAG TPA: hypothetical protein VLA34_02910, partial [Candidatus Krumholzibacterium sp.]|nr:hypothetical protein [Candidatus Krumholzibacterium sp.]
MKRTIFLILILASVSSCSGDRDSAGTITDVPALEARSYDVHIFYYPWYANPQVDGEYRWWTGTPANDPRGSVSHQGGTDIASSFFPAYGPYSSADPNIIKSHIDQIAAAKIGTICVTWWDADSLASAPVKGIMDTAAVSNLKVCFRIEVSEGATATDVMRQVCHLIDTYGGHKAFYISDRFGKRPIFYIGGSWLIEVDDWASCLTGTGSGSVRGTPYDALFIGVWKDEKDGERLEQAGFDGFYTWFAARGASWGSDAANFQEMNLFAMDSELLFIPTVS